MQTRGDFVQSIQKYIKSLPTDHLNVDLIPLIESHFSLSKLENLLEKYENSKEVLTKESVEPFKAFLTERWRCIHGTNAIYCHQPDSPITQACLEMAKGLSIILKEPVYDLLMSPLMSKNYKTSKGTLDDLHLREFVLSDKGEPIEVMACIDNFRNEKLLYHTCLNQLGESEKNELNEAEMKRVICHSDESKAYYMSLLANKSQTERNDKRKLLENLLRENTFTVKSRYNAASNKRVTSFIFANINTASELVSIIHKYVPRNQAHDFIRDIPDIDLLRLLLGKSEIVSLSEAQPILKIRLDEMRKQLHASSVSVDEIEKIAGMYLICVIEVCKRCRSEESSYRTWSGKLFGSWVPSYSGVVNKESRLKTFDLLLDFLLENKKFNKLSDFLAKPEMLELQAAFNSGTSKMLIDEIEKLKNLFDVKRTTLTFS